ncbi:hypothetical protein [Psychrobacillus sp. NEAU-3TGS]|uniref:hypothetical protein n=1 Tax=Psychrobacillus sp. NEAU-3TGS TaxID=2995412 RepID=UPI00249C85A3|nr:hypothetical protein [Psychrobacillus sp. NEAU-3TGS]
MHKLHKWPSEFDSLPKYEKAFVIAAVQLKMENDKKQEKETKRKGKGRGKK